MDMEDSFTLTESTMKETSRMILSKAKDLSSMGPTDQLMWETGSTTSSMAEALFTTSFRLLSLPGSTTVISTSWETVGSNIKVYFYLLRRILLGHQVGAGKDHNDERINNVGQLFEGSPQRRMQFHNSGWFEDR
jgi:hypothetical protein